MILNTLLVPFIEMMNLYLRVLKLKKLASIFKILLLVNFEVRTLVKAEISIILKDVDLFNVVCFTKRILILFESLNVPLVEINARVVKFLQSSMGMNAHDIRKTILAKCYDWRPTMSWLSLHWMIDNIVIDVNKISLKRNSVNICPLKLNCCLIAFAWVAHDLERLWFVGIFKLADRHEIVDVKLLL